MKSSMLARFHLYIQQECRITLELLCFIKIPKLPWTALNAPSPALRRKLTIAPDPPMLYTNVTRKTRQVQCDEDLLLARSHYYIQWQYRITLVWSGEKFGGHPALVHQTCSLPHLLCLTAPGESGSVSQEKYPSSISVLTRWFNTLESRAEALKHKS